MNGLTKEEMAAFRDSITTNKSCEAFMQMLNGYAPDLVIRFLMTGEFDADVVNERLIVLVEHLQALQVNLRLNQKAWTAEAEYLSKCHEKDLDAVKRIVDFRKRNG